MIVMMLGVWASLLLARGTPTGRFLSRWLVEWPAARLNATLRGTWVTLGLLLVIGVVAMIVLEGDGVRLAGMFAPEIATWLTAFEVSAYVDALLVAVTAASALRVSGVRMWIAARMPGRAARKRARRVRAVRPVANDDEDGRVALSA